MNFTNFISFTIKFMPITKFKSSNVTTSYDFFYSARNARIASAVLATAIRPSVRPSVRHTPVLCQNDGTQHGAFRVVSIFWQGDDPFPLKPCLQVTCPLLSMASYGRCQNS